jgi:hypothetical protein
MATEQALDALVAAFRVAFADHRAADFPIAYRIARDWFRVPIDDRRDEVFHLACGPLRTPKHGYFSLCRVLRRPADGAYVQVWVVFSDKHGRAEGSDWTSHRCWSGREFAGPDEAFAALEATPEFGWASERFPWQVDVEWRRSREPAVDFDDLRRSALP